MKICCINVTKAPDYDAVERILLLSGDMTTKLQILIHFSSAYFYFEIIQAKFCRSHAFVGTTYSFKILLILSHVVNSTF